MTISDEQLERELSTNQPAIAPGQVWGVPSIHPDGYAAGVQIVCRYPLPVPPASGRVWIVHWIGAREDQLETFTERLLRIMMRPFAIKQEAAE